MGESFAKLAMARMESYHQWLLKYSRTDKVHFTLHGDDSIQKTHIWIHHEVISSKQVDSPEWLDFTLHGRIILFSRILCHIGLEKVHSNS